MSDYEMMWKELKKYCERAEVDLYKIGNSYLHNPSEMKRVIGKADGVGTVLCQMNTLERTFNRED